MKKSKIDINELVESYKVCGNLHKLAKKFHTSHIRLSNMLKDIGFEINKLGNEKIITENELEQMVNDYNISNLSMEEVANKYNIGVKKLRKVFKENGIQISKWRNHTKKVVEKKPILKNDKIGKEVKKCPYCDWETIDISNKSNAFEKHIKVNHPDINIEEHLREHQEDKKYFLSYFKRKGKIKCEICGKYFNIIDIRYLNKCHNMSKEEYIGSYPKAKLVSDSTKEKLQYCIQRMNENEDWERNISVYEKDIMDFISSFGLECYRDRTILNGREIDILVPSKMIGIEFNGNKWHTEWFGGKTRYSHLSKTIDCEKNGIKLLHIFEDEYRFKKNIVLTKIKHILGINNDLPRVMARKCTVNEIDRELAEIFLNENHIQGFSCASLYLGCFFNKELVGVMTFKKESKTSQNWELTRFATMNGYICQGVGGKLFKYFVKNYNPIEIKSFADRRWTLDKDNNLYIRLGFVLEGILKPDYRYYNSKVNKYVRFHKFNFRKETLRKKYGFPMTMTETEMVKELGYDRIWDCGLFKYVWRK